MRDYASRCRRLGGLSCYDLSSGAAMRKYHEIHVWQLRLLARISGDRCFWRLAARLRDDARPTGHGPGRPAVLHRLAAGCPDADVCA